MPTVTVAEAVVTAVVTVAAAVVEFVNCSPKVSVEVAPKPTAPIADESVTRVPLTPDTTVPTGMPKPVTD